MVYKYKMEKIDSQKNRYNFQKLTFFNSRCLIYEMRRIYYPDLFGWANYKYSTTSI